VPIPNYGILKARPITGRRGTAHYHIRAVVGGTHYRVAVNVQSDVPPSELCYVVAQPFTHPKLSALAALPQGFTPVPSRPGGLALDFVRQALFERRDLRKLAADRPGPNNDLEDIVGSLIGPAIRDPRGMIYAIGSRWGPERRTPDRIFGFTPGNGVHDLHMNQGNSARFRADDGVWQDGALLIQLSQPALAWAAVFLAFQSQAWRTDDVSGHARR
jgi:uncharacterized protein YukJ